MIHYRKSFIGLAARWKHRNAITVISPLICSDDGAAAPRPEGAGDGSCVPPTGSGDGCACRLDGTWAQGVCGGTVVGWGARGAAAAARHRPLAELLCGGDGGPCRGCMVGLCSDLGFQSTHALFGCPNPPNTCPHMPTHAHTCHRHNMSDTPSEPWSQPAVNLKW